MRFWTPAGRPKGAGPGWARVNAKAGCRSRRPQGGARRARAQDGPASTRGRMPKQTPEGAPEGRGPRMGPRQSELLFDLGGLLQAFDVFLEFLLHEGVGQLRLHLVERRVARVYELDDVPAVLGLHGVGREVAFLQALD